MGVSRKQNTPNTCAYQGVKKCLFFGKFGLLCFLETPVLRFALLPYYRRYNCIYFKELFETERDAKERLTDKLARTAEKLR